MLQLKNYLIAQIKEIMIIDMQKNIAQTILHRKNLILLFIFCSILYSTPQLRSQSNEDCLTCHSDNDLTMEKRGKTVSLFVNENHLKNSVHKKLNCISCHAGFDPEEVPHKEKIEPINCTTCHKDAGAKHQFHPQLLKAKSGSNGTPDLSCKGCHGTHQVVSTKSANSPFNKTNVSQTCIKCHKEQGESYGHSDHARALREGVKGAPNCITCHKAPITFSAGRDTLKVKIAQEELCLSCHLDNPDVRNRIASTDAFIKAYEHSVHGKALLGGNAKSANCVDCHSSHEIEKGTNPISTVFKMNVPQTCAKCHEDIAKEYEESVHGVAVKNRNMASPVCTDCHGEHNILKHNDPNSPVSFQNVSSQVCSPCHNSVKLSERYGISADRFKTFTDSYHGLALKGGSAEVANCGSCHGVHNIKSSSDPTSMVHKANLAVTCGKCHPGANDNFAVGTVHVTMGKDEDPLLYWIANLYILLIIATIGGMFFHNTIDFIRKSINKLKVRRGILPHHRYGKELYVRMTKAERLQHVTLMLSFFLLVITGFMLRFPDAWWVRYIREYIPNAFELRSLLHRIAAVVMVVVSLYHVFYLSFTERGRQLFKDMLPRWKDVKDVSANFRYNLGLSSEKPQFGRFSYIEKAEYLALIWGTIVMTVTGFVMWFDNTFIGMFTKLGWDIARVIHYYEAWLAFLSILVWHIYFVIFNPDSYPMNLAWIKGTLTEEEMAEDHPLELEEIKARKAQEEDLGNK